MLADAVDQQDQPLDGLPLKRGKAGTIGQSRGHWPEVGPTLIKVDQVARQARFALLTLSPFGIFFGSGHGRRLMQDPGPRRVNKA
jgi:hypothetical protein